jgi:hypothetical protein
MMKNNLRFESDGTKVNPIILNGCNSADVETLGNYLIRLNAIWKPAADAPDDMKIGSLYDFDLFIRRQKEAYVDNGLYEYKYQNVFYAESKSGIKYSWNDGYINVDNPKLAARYFINSIDRVTALKEKYQKNLHDLEQNIPMLKQIIAKPFEKESELAALKKDVTKLEREISVRIQANKIKQEEKLKEVNEAPVIKMNKELKSPKILLPKRESAKRKSLRI